MEFPGSLADPTFKIAFAMAGETGDVTRTPATAATQMPFSLADRTNRIALIHVQKTCAIAKPATDIMCVPMHDPRPSAAIARANIVPFSKSP